jgi:hypothetical protein
VRCLPRRRIQIDEALHCSFCRKAQDSVQKLISSPSDCPRAYICDECITVCDSILDDDHQTPEVDVLRTESDESHSLLNHPLTPQLLSAIERWIRQESLGGDAAEEFAEVRATAIRWMRPGTKK